MSPKCFTNYFLIKKKTNQFKKKQISFKKTFNFKFKAYLLKMVVQNNTVLKLKIQIYIAM